MYDMNALYIGPNVQLNYATLQETALSMHHSMNKQHINPAKVRIGPGSVRYYMNKSSSKREQCLK